MVPAANGMSTKDSLVIGFMGFPMYARRAARAH
jgi:hypothetical protein